MCCVWSGMADVFTSEQAEKVDRLLQKYTTLDTRGRRSFRRDVKDVIKEDVSFRNRVLSDWDFIPGVDIQKFFEKLIRVITGIRQVEQVTQVNLKIFHFTWHYGVHNNIYRIKCHVNPRNSSRYWVFQKITDDWYDQNSGADTDDEGMNFDDINFQDEDEWADDWDQVNAANLRTQFDSMHTIISAIESMHTRLCKLGV